jgi:RNA polymerase sigma-70 factor (ECF subfamily)
MNLSARDQQLLTQLKQAKPRAVQLWFATYHHKLLGLVQTKVQNPKDAEELVQDTFVSCLKHLPLFRGESSIWTWMVRIAQHEIADYYRKFYAKKIIHALPLSEMLFAQHLDSGAELSEKVKAVLLKMAKESKELLLLKYIDKKPVKEIALAAKRTVKAIESDLFRARAEFKKLYEAEHS